MVNKYLGIEIPELAAIPEDPQVIMALKAFLPISELYPSAPSSVAMQNAANKLVKLTDLFSSQNSDNAD